VSGLIVIYGTNSRTVSAR